MIQVMLGGTNDKKSDIDAILPLKSYRTKIGIKLGVNRTIYRANKEDTKFIF